MWWMVVAAVAAVLQHSAEPEAFRLAVNPAFAMSPAAFRAVVDRAARD